MISASTASIYAAHACLACSLLSSMNVGVCFARPSFGNLAERTHSTSKSFKSSFMKIASSAANFLPSRKRLFKSGASIEPSFKFSREQLYVLQKWKIRNLKAWNFPTFLVIRFREFFSAAARLFPFLAILIDFTRISSSDEIAQYSPDVRFTLKGFSVRVKINWKLWKRLPFLALNSTKQWLVDLHELRLQFLKWPVVNGTSRKHLKVRKSARHLKFH